MNSKKKNILNLFSASKKSNEFLLKEASAVAELIESVGEGSARIFRGLGLADEAADRLKAAIRLENPTAAKVAIKQALRSTNKLELIAHIDDISYVLAYSKHIGGYASGSIASRASTISNDLVKIYDKINDLKSSGTLNIESLRAALPSSSISNFKLKTDLTASSDISEFLTKIESELSELKNFKEGAAHLSTTINKINALGIEGVDLAEEAASADLLLSKFNNLENARDTFESAKRVVTSAPPPPRPEGEPRAETGEGGPRTDSDSSGARTEDSVGSGPGEGEPRPGTTEPGPEVRSTDSRPIEPDTSESLNLGGYTRKDFPPLNLKNQKVTISKKGDDGHLVVKFNDKYFYVNPDQARLIPGNVGSEVTMLWDSFFSEIEYARTAVSSIPSNATPTDIAAEDILEFVRQNPDGTKVYRNTRKFSEYTLSAEQEAALGFQNIQDEVFRGGAAGRKKVTRPLANVPTKRLSLPSRVLNAYKERFWGKPKSTMAWTALGLTLTGIPLAALGFWLYGSWAEAEQAAKMKESIDDFAADSKDLTGKLKAKKMKPGTKGEAELNKYTQKREELVNKLAAVPVPQKSVNDMTPEEQAEAQKSGEQVAELAAEIEKLDKEFVEKAPELSKDLQNPAEAEEFVAVAQSLQELSASASNEIMAAAKPYADSFMKGYLSKDEGEEQKEQQGRGGKEPFGQKPFAPSAPAPRQFKSNKIEIPSLLGVGRTLEIGDLPQEEQFRIKTQLLPLIQSGNPSILTFIDPRNEGSAYLAKTGDPEKDLRKALRFLAQNELTTPFKIRGKLKDKYPTGSDRRALRKIRKSYRKDRGQDFSEQFTGTMATESEANDFISEKRAKRMQNIQNILKSAQFSINNIGKNMNKKAQQQDSFIDSYSKDALRGVEDAYVKSYFAGLNSVQKGEGGQKYSELYNVHKETGEDLVLSAHPTTVSVVEAKGIGGVMENTLEQHRKMLDVAFNVPSGNFRSKYAFVISQLVKIANEADANGNLEAATLIDDFLSELE